MHFINSLNFYPNSYIVNFCGEKPGQKNPEINKTPAESNLTSNKLLKALGLSAAALTGKASIKTSKKQSQVVQSEDTSAQAERTEDKIPEFNNEAEADYTFAETILPSGVKKHDKIQTDTLAGTMIDTTLTPPVNGVSRLKIHRFSNGDLSQVKTYDEAGKVLKEITYEHNYMLRRKPDTVVITGENGQTTTINFDFLGHKPNQVKSVTVEKPNGETKTTVIEPSVNDKIVDRIISIKNGLY